jgi:hypothetical protein
MKELMVTYKGVSLLVLYEFERGDMGDHHTGPTADSCTIDSVFAGNVNILNILTEKQEDEIKDLLYLHHN